MSDPTIRLDLTTNKFILHLPGPEAGHHVSIPPTERGLAALFQVLRNRALSEEQQIGTAASPTQEMLEAILANWSGEITKVPESRRLSPWDRKMEALMDELEDDGLDLEIEIKEL